MLAPVASASFEKDIEHIEILAATPVTSADLLARNLQFIYERAAKARFDDYEVAEIAKHAQSLMYRLFDLRVGLRNHLQHYEMLGLMTPDVTQGFRDVFRVLRYVSDMLGEITTGHPRVGEGGYLLRGFTGADNNTLVNYPFYRSGTAQHFRSGDVILVRGTAHNSAAIARIGDVDSQFSHIGIVYIDPAGDHWMVESLIEDGAVINPLAKALDHNIVRAVLYRNRDADLAARAAKCIFDYVAASRAKGGKRILYDFSMRTDDTRNLFCSKLVRLAYEQGSFGMFKLPTYPTKIARKNRDFLDRVGVATDLTFAPADIDMESGFDLVAEWQDYRETAGIRLQDFTMDKLFEWMERFNYRFDETAAIKLVSVLGRFASHFSEGAKDVLSSVFPRVPINMPRKTVAVVAMLHKTAEPIYHELMKLNQDAVADTGVPLHGLDVMAALERIREREGNRIGYLVRRGR
ncbi:YiiX/YebB-like N1pC/P60 family cysteine hydrolase [Hyphomicrobium facile]|uniref:Permuted papain-like amidase enzyme, YaeF/YiiX, C92 family n=1 Tax=Hyphomicrobium facile TaxID=51670 RepID=A0A1I7MWS5_9HYPH|nr:YiiX/YebB-like N1pC/P60 family cysteine hydrolase [Hyphomicrobium facile]SFV26861.1 Permuted papain-like amidase enzyme, YaeF/YiiX, C92 family [Hyphomicrobium facile]